ncbi:MAG: hypothetical protein VX112_02145 [Pseudomonadota bacterium]|nr:hypothetical protein [Pseudomonadota bacterium]
MKDYLSYPHRIIQVFLFLLFSFFISISFATAKSSKANKFQIENLSSKEIHFDYAVYEDDQEIERKYPCSDFDFGGSCRKLHANLDYMSLMVWPNFSSEFSFESPRNQDLYLKQIYNKKGPCISKNFVFPLLLENGLRLEVTNGSGWKDKKCYVKRK